MAFLPFSTGALADLVENFRSVEEQILEPDHETRKVRVVILPVPLGPNRRKRLPRAIPCGSPQHISRNALGVVLIGH